jgi:hypothetical protein
MFSFLIQNSVLIREVIRHQYDFAYTTLDALMEAIARRRDLAALENSLHFDFAAARTKEFLGSAGCTRVLTHLSHIVTPCRKGIRNFI